MMALVPSILVSGFNADELYAPLQPSTSSAGSYYLLMLADRAQDPHCAAFCSWIKEQAAQVQATSVPA